jgi:hypothetical protein
VRCKPSADAARSVVFIKSWRFIADGWMLVKFRNQWNFQGLQSLSFLVLGKRM